MSKTNAPYISIVIPAYNEATYIGRLLSALTKQEFTDFEVIVSDAESKDGTAAVVASFQKQLNVRLVETPPQGPGAGRNEGARVAQGTWLLFLDADDDIDESDFLGILIAEAEAHGWKTASTKMKVRDATIAERFGTWFNYVYVKSLARSKHPVAAGWCILTRRELFEEHGGFNPKIHFGEDYDYVTRSSRGVFGFTDKTYYYMDLRRAREEGIQFAIKGFMNEVYRYTHHYNLERNHIPYVFGKHRPK